MSRTAEFVSGAETFADLSKPENPCRCIQAAASPAYLAGTADASRSMLALPEDGRPPMTGADTGPVRLPPGKLRKKSTPPMLTVSVCSRFGAAGQISTGPGVARPDVPIRLTSPTTLPSPSHRSSGQPASWSSRRPQARPLVPVAVEAAHGLAFGVALGVVAFVFLWATTTLMAAVLALAALLFYVFIYTIWLKRRTPQNIVIGGAAGAFPPMVGWAAVTGDVSLAPLVMFAIIFFWTPPHFWALALRLKDDYAEAGVPMLPVTDGPAFTRIQILRYSVMLVVVSMMLGPAANLSFIYYATAVGSGAVFIAMAYQLWRKHETTPPINLYKYSLLYLALVFVAMGADAAVLG